MRAKKKTDVLKVLRAKSGYIFVLCVFFIFLQAGIFAGHHHQQLASYPDVSSETGKKWLPEKSSILSLSASTRLIKEHPIPRLMEEAENKYRRKLGGQSKTLKAAVAEYKKRYKRDPPKGFDEWWKFAQKHEVKMVDEYNGLMEDLAPFWTLSGQELRRRALQVIFIWFCDLSHR
jgi:hypothetical protein